MKTASVTEFSAAEQGHEARGWRLPFRTVTTIANRSANGLNSLLSSSNPRRQTLNIVRIKVVAMPHFKFLSLRLNMVRLLSLMCLLFITAGISAAQTPSVSINDIAAVEGDVDLFGHEFELRLSAPSTNTITVTATTQNGTAIGDVD